jgi:hypothetical protein
MCTFETSYQTETQPLTGVWDAQFSAIRAQFDTLTKNARPKMVYLGIASSGKDGCKSRWNAKYKVCFFAIYCFQGSRTQSYGTALYEL